MTSWVKQNYPFVPVFIAVLCTALLDQAFAKFKIGPVYSLELCVFVWGVLAMVAGWHRSLRFSEIKATAFAGAFAFFIWGILRLSYDLFFRPDEISSVMRVLQHSLIFVYPLLWMTVGFLTFRRSPQAVRVLAVATLIACIGVALVRNPHGLNIGLGSVAAAGFMIVVARSWKLNGKILWLGLLALLVLEPFARDISRGVVQRVLMTELAVLIVAVPFFYNGKGRLWRSVLQSTLVFGFAGLLTISEIAILTDREGLSFSDTVALQASKSLRHGDDIPGGKIEEHPAPDVFLKAGYRRFWWAQAYRDWQQNPVVGRGFIPEIPSYVREGIPNDGQYGPKGDFRVRRPNVPITGPHNSYLSILARMGAVGALIFLGFFAQICALVWRVLRNSRGKVFGILAVAFIFDGLSTAVLQVGLESPYNCFVLWFFVGTLVAERNGK